MMPFMIMDLVRAVQSHPQGCTIRFEVVAGASKLAVPSGFNPWRAAIEARLTAPPTRGRANQQLTEEVARVLNVPQATVQVLSGQKVARKVLLVIGISAENAISSLNGSIK